jgi:hypothetical protein
MNTFSGLRFTIGRKSPFLPTLLKVFSHCH